MKIDKMDAVLEHGWGETGPTEPEDAITFNVGLMSFDSGVSQQVKSNIELVLEHEVNGDPKDAITFVEKEGGGTTQRGQAWRALTSALYELVSYEGSGDEFPLVKGLFKGDSAPLTLCNLTPDEFGYAEAYGLKFPMSGIVFVETPKASNQDYETARNMLVDEANGSLELFKVDFRIPQFPIDNK